MKLRIPNLLSILRLVAAPILLWLAWHDHKSVFLIVFICAVITDGLDGYLARRWRQTSALGAKLDSWGDVAIYFTLAISAYLLWPQIFFAEKIYFQLMMLSIILPAIFGLFKFHALTSYHTWLVKIAAASAVVSVLLLFAGYSPWPFRIAAGLCIAAAMEQVAITLILNRPLTDIRSFQHARKINRTQS